MRTLRIYANMAAEMSMVIIIFNVWFFALLFPGVDTAEPRVELTSMVHPVTVGGLIAIRCQIWNMQEDYSVSLLRVRNGRTVPITIGDAYLTQDFLYLASRTFTDGINVFFWTIIGASQDKEGKYVCRISNLETGSNIAEDSTIILLYSFPETLYPACRSDPVQPVTVYVNNKLRLTCTSEKAFPMVELEWSCNNPSIHFTRRNTTSHDMASSEITFISEMTHNGMVCSCQLSSKGFPNRHRECRIGPITILSKTAVATGNEVSPTLISDDTSSGGKRTILKSANCDNSECSSQTAILYLILSTTGASILCVTFMTTTIIFCCKYQRITNEINVAQRGRAASNRMTEPVYVSLQRRSTGERTYVTLDDPNNPENKVLMPQEVYEQFYRTLSVKGV